MNRYGFVFKALLTRKGISCRELAIKAGYAPCSFFPYTSGLGSGRWPSLRTIAIHAHYSGATKAELYELIDAALDDVLRDEGFTLDD